MEERLCQTRRRRAPLIRLPAPSGVEPRVSTRPSDPRKRGEGGMPRPLFPSPTSRRARPLSPSLRGEG
ncbi:hypothetical protein EHI42_08910 [Rhizobium hidalgonense]|nr:hypothetical protein EHI42_08910 [Rhizobium hidalgonense]